MLILSINNDSHEVKLRHDDGTESSFIVPESERFPSSKKLAYIKSQVRPAKKGLRKLSLLQCIAIAEAIIIIALLIKVL